MSDDFSKYLNKQLQNDEFAKVWNSTEARYQVINTLIRLRKEYKLTQSELAQKVGTTQNIISKIERGKMNIGLDFLSKIAEAFGRKLEVKFCVWDKKFDWKIFLSYNHRNILAKSPKFSRPKLLATP